MRWQVIGDAEVLDIVPVRDRSLGFEIYQFDPAFTAVRCHPGDPQVIITRWAREGCGELELARYPDRPGQPALLCSGNAGVSVPAAFGDYLHRLLIGESEPSGWEERGQLIPFRPRRRPA